MMTGRPIGHRLLLVIMLGVLSGWTLPPRLAGDAPVTAPLGAARTASSPLTAVQPVQEPDAWGEPVDGVQLRLAVSKNASPSLPGELPVFEVQLRNLGDGPATFVAEAIVFSNIEINGVWYTQLHAGSCCASPREIVSGALSDTLPLRVLQTTLFELHAAPARSVELRPGKHSIRVRSVSRELFYVHTFASRGVALLSNTVTVDVPDLSPLAERQALIRQASAGGASGIPAARRLVEKYPDAALKAIAAAVEATRDASLRSQYVGLAAPLPGDEPVAFLTSQLAPSAGLLSQVRAAEALLARGQDDWLPGMIEEWRNVDRRVSRTTPDQDAEALLIALLARSGSAEAVDALGQDTQAPVDVRLAVVQTFLPPPVNAGSRTQSGTGSSLTLMARADMPTLPGGAAGAAIERLLRVALDDKRQRFGLKGTYDGVSYANPRVCDMAAFVFSRRWPEKYRFTWPASPAERDAQIAMIRNTWRQR